MTRERRAHLTMREPYTAAVVLAAALLLRVRAGLKSLKNSGGMENGWPVKMGTTELASATSPFRRVVVSGTAGREVKVAVLLVKSGMVKLTVASGFPVVVSAALREVKVAVPSRLPVKSVGIANAEKLVAVASSVVLVAAAESVTAASSVESVAAASSLESVAAEVEFELELPSSLSLILLTTSEMTLLMLDWSSGSMSEKTLSSASLAKLRL